MPSSSNRLVDNLSPRQQNALIVLGLLSVSIPLVVESTHFLLRWRNRRKERETAKKSHRQIYRVVLTGGPCSGKTSSLNHLKAACHKAGYECVVIPEVPSILIDGGAAYPGIDAAKRLITFEVALLGLQLQMEDSFTSIARSLEKPTVVICDRGCVDVSAYLLPQDWQSTLQVLGLTTQELTCRYDQVVHLVTAADGAPSFYTLSNNTARTETAKDARVIDRRIKSAWQLHPFHVVVDNSTDFEGKLERCTESVLGGASQFFKVAGGAGSEGEGNGGRDGGVGKKVN